MSTENEFTPTLNCVIDEPDVKQEMPKYLQEAPSQQSAADILLVAQCIGAAFVTGAVIGALVVYAFSNPVISIEE